MADRKTAIAVAILVLCASSIGIGYAIFQASHTTHDGTGDVSYAILKIKEGDSTVSTARFADTESSKTHEIHYFVGQNDYTTCMFNFDTSGLPALPTGKTYKVAMFVTISSSYLANEKVTVTMSGDPSAEIKMGADGKGIAYGFTWNGTDMKSMNIKATTGNACIIPQSADLDITVTAICSIEDVIS